jgi:hypothetical protein
MHDPETIQEIAQSSDLSSPLVDSDPRIRDYDPDERSQVEDWMEVGSEMMMVHRILEVRPHFLIRSFIHLVLIHSLGLNATD